MIPAFRVLASVLKMIGLMLIDFISSSLKADSIVLEMFPFERVVSLCCIFNRLSLNWHS